MIMAKHCIGFIIFTFVIIQSNCFAKINFSFDSGLHKFGLWGSGIGKYDENIKVHRVFIFGGSYNIIV